MLDGHWIAGGVVSATTMTRNEQVLRLLQLSAAVQVTVFVPGGNTLPEAGTQVTFGLGSRLSETTGDGKFTTPPAEEQTTTLVFPGHRIVGGVVSRTTVTVKVQVARLVQLSVAVQTTAVVPTGNELPDGGVQVTRTLVSALSVAAGNGKVTGTVDAVPHSTTVRLVGHVSTGGRVSCATVTVKVQVAVSRQALVARQVTTVEPRMKVDPEGGVQTTVGVPVQLSVVVGSG